MNHAERFMWFATSCQKLECALVVDPDIQRLWAYHITNDNRLATQPYRNCTTILQILDVWLNNLRNGLNTVNVPRLGMHANLHCRCFPAPSDGRKVLPACLRNFWLDSQKVLELDWTVDPHTQDGFGHKITVSWVSAFLADILPDQAIPGWTVMECSHRCAIDPSIPGSGFCLENHLVWESKAENQSRGNPRCRLLCSHAGCVANQSICECLGFHNPSCC